MLSAIGIMLTTTGVTFAFAHYQHYKRNKVLDEIHATCDDISIITKKMMDDSI